MESLSLSLAKTPWSSTISLKAMTELVLEDLAKFWTPSTLLLVAGNS